jgi:hypothetical protein
MPAQAASAATAGRRLILRLRRTCFKFIPSLPPPLRVAGSVEGDAVRRALRFVGMVLPLDAVQRVAEAKIVPVGATAIVGLKAGTTG